MAQFDILAIYLPTELPRISIMCLQMSVLKQLTITKGVCLQPDLHKHKAWSSNSPQALWAPRLLSHTITEYTALPNETALCAVSVYHKAHGIQLGPQQTSALQVCIA